MLHVCHGDKLQLYFFLDKSLGGLQNCRNLAVLLSESRVVLIQSELDKN